jgi:outer membrane protein OmpA-like peptidoglycan-associated protein
MKKMMIVCLGLLLGYTAKAQTDQLRWGIGGYGGLINYNGDRGQNFYNYASKQAAYGFGGLEVSRYLSRHFQVNLDVTSGQIGNMQPVSSWSTQKDLVNRHFLIQTNMATANLQYNILGPEYKVSPFLFAGAGGMLSSSQEHKGTYHLDGVPLSTGGGLMFRVNDYMNFKIQEQFIYAGTDALDKTVRKNPAILNYNDGFLYHSAGLVFNLGKMPDADADGVSDKKDNCAGTPKGVLVDEHGCPLDRDNDGVADYLDQCPDTKGVSSLDGCPDADGDGIADKDDRCPNYAGSIANSGCPDADADGVVDIDDKCPGTKAGYKVDATGCALDNDKDGIVNEEDRCPDLAGPLSLKGCPDSDGDGVSDMDDRCPKTKGTLENKGCPEIAKEDAKKITMIASQIYFETGKATLKQASLAQLDALVIILNKYPEANLTIEGHTDNVGGDQYNMDLSQRRTESVKAYLMSKGIFESRLKAIGFGETKPIADNKTASGRAKNRRVELHTAY